MLVAVFVGGSVAYGVWSLLDHREVDALRGQVEALERRLLALEAEHASAKPE
jgi:hypothetical protein